MTKSQLLKELFDRLSSLLADPAAADALRDRASRCNGTVADALFEYNRSVSEEILSQNVPAGDGEVPEATIAAFRECLTHYLREHSTGRPEYDRYIAIISEYLALVAQKPMHPPAVRRMGRALPDESPDRPYCALKPRHIRDPLSLCRFCNCLEWPDGPTGNRTL